MKDTKTFFGIASILVGFISVATALCYASSFSPLQLLPKSVEWRGGSKASTTEFMNAVAYTSKNGALTFYQHDYPKPILRDDQVLVKVMASSVNPVDFKLRRNAKFIPNFVLPQPKIPGADLAGKIVQVGSKVEALKLNDRVAAMIPLFGQQWGANAEYVALNASLVSKIPENVDYQSAASIPLVSLTTFKILSKLSSPTKGKKILIHAGAGGVGTFAIQYAKHVLGMYVATTASKEKTNLLQSLGADLVIDYTSQDFTSLLQDYDVVLDPMSYLYERKSLQCLKRSGHYLNILSSGWSLRNGKEQGLGIITIWNLIKHKLVNFIAPGRICKYDLAFVEPNGSQLKVALELVGSGTIRPVIDKVYSLSDVGNAHDYLETGHATGKVVIEHE